MFLVCSHVSVFLAILSVSLSFCMLFLPTKISIPSFSYFIGADGASLLLNLFPGFFMMFVLTNSSLMSSSSFSD